MRSMWNVPFPCSPLPKVYGRIPWYKYSCALIHYPLMPSLFSHVGSISRVFVTFNVVICVCLATFGVMKCIVWSCRLPCFVSHFVCTTPAQWMYSTSVKHFAHFFIHNSCIVIFCKLLPSLKTPTTALWIAHEMGMVWSRSATQISCLPHMLIFVI